MDYPKYIDTWDSPFCFKGSQVKFINYVFLSLKFVLIFANSADNGEMPPYVTMHLGVRCLQKYLLTVI